MLHHSSQIESLTYVLHTSPLNLGIKVVKIIKSLENLDSNINFHFYFKKHTIQNSVKQKYYLLQTNFQFDTKHCLQDKKQMFSALMCCNLLE